MRFIVMWKPRIILFVITALAVSAGYMLHTQITYPVRSPTVLNILGSIVYVLSWGVVFSASQIFFLSFWKMEYKYDGTLCMCDTHPLFKWYGYCFSFFYSVIGDVNTIWVKSTGKRGAYVPKRWDGSITTCGMVWLFVPFILLEVMLLAIVATLGFGVYSYLIGEWSLSEIKPESIILVSAMLWFLIAINLTGVKNKVINKIGTAMFIIFLAGIIGGMIYGAGVQIQEMGFLNTLSALFSVLWSGILALSLAVVFIVLSALGMYLAYRFVPALKNTMVGKFFGLFHKKTCITITTCESK